MDKRIHLSRRHFVKRISTAFAVQALPLTAYCQEKDGLTIACLCDPQLGFYTSSRPVQGYAPDLANLHQAVSQMNELKPDIVLVAGDMVQTLGKKSVTDVNDALAVLTMPYMLTPGNHDIAPPVTKDKITAYYHYFGSDKVSRLIKGFKIVSGNSQLWTKGVAY
ncbi:MAG: metallophosphoesterase [Kiritimatiellae bacterium]|nr:metallophosphoesterase [Kiritimatiellia bacterium]